MSATDLLGKMYSGLIRCPFCGAENTDINFIAHTDDCFLLLKYLGKETKSAWNRRPQEEALEREIRELEAELLELKNKLEDSHA